MLKIKGKVNQKSFIVGQVVTFALLSDRHLIMTTMGGGTFYDKLGSFAFSNPSTKLTFFHWMCLFSGSEEEDELVETYMTCYDTGIERFKNMTKPMVNINVVHCSTLIKNTTFEQFTTHASRTSSYMTQSVQICIL